MSSEENKSGTIRSSRQRAAVRETGTGGGQDVGRESFGVSGARWVIVCMKGLECCC